MTWDLKSWFIGFEHRATRCPSRKGIWGCLQWCYCVSIVELSFDIGISELDGHGVGHGVLWRVAVNIDHLFGFKRAKLFHHSRNLLFGLLDLLGQLAKTKKKLL